MDVVDLFAGPRGWDTGLRDHLGITSVLGVEWDEDAHATAIAVGHAGVLADVASLDPRAFAGGATGLIASPPCQGFSLAGSGRGRGDTAEVLRGVQELRAGRDPRRTLDLRDHRSEFVLEPLRWTLDLMPEWTCWEQVPPVRPLWQTCAEVLRERGYCVWTGNLQAERYGVPQTRKRALLIASRTRAVGMPTPTHSAFHSRDRGRLDEGVLPWVSMAQALGHYDESQGGGPRWQYVNGNQAHSARHDMHEPAPTVHFSQRMNSVEWQPVAMSSGTRRGAVVRDSSEPAPSFAFGHDAASYTWVPPGTRPLEVAALKADGTARRVSVQEAAVLQTFPSDHPWRGSRSAQYRQVGDAVPPLLAAHVVAEATGAARLPID